MERVEVLTKLFGVGIFFAKEKRGGNNIWPLFFILFFYFFTIKEKIVW